MDSDAAVVQPQGGTISGRTKACQQLFTLCLSPAVPRCAEFPAQWLQMRQAEFNLWAYGLQALSTSKASLDYRVRDRSDVRQILLGLLSALCEDLQECLRIDAELSRRTEGDATSAQPEGQVEDDSDFGFADFSEDGSDVDSHPSESGDAHFGSQKFSLRLTITELARFSSMMRRSGTEFRFRRADSLLVESEYLDYQEELARSVLLGSIQMDQGAPFDIELFQSANVSDKLTPVQKRLIRGNVLRQNRIMHATKKMRSSRAPPTSGLKPMPKPLAIGTAGTIPSSGSRETTAPIEQPAINFTQTERDSAPSLVESRITGFTAHTATEIGQHFKPGLSTPKSTPSVATKVTRTGAFQDYPRCPEPITEEFIQCPYCADVLPTEYTENVVRWKGHVAQDILPYMCVFESCSAPDEMYLTSDDLLKHVQDRHSMLQWVCSLCARSPDRSRESTFNTMAEWQLHTREAHRKLVPDSSLSSLGKFSEARVLEPISCPLCAFSSEGVQKTLDQHIVQHIHEFALRSLPWGTKGNDAKSVSNARTATSDSTNLSDEALSEDGMGQDAMMAKLEYTFLRLREYMVLAYRNSSRSSRSPSGSSGFRTSIASTYKKEASSRGSTTGPVVIHHHARGYDASAPKPDYSVISGQLTWPVGRKYEITSRVDNISQRYLATMPSTTKTLDKDQTLIPLWLPVLTRAGDILYLAYRFVSKGRTYTESCPSWLDGSLRNLESMLDAVEAEVDAIHDDFERYRRNDRPPDLSIRPFSFDIPSLDESELFLPAPIKSRIASDGNFLVLLSGPPRSGKTRNAAQYAWSESQKQPGLRVFWVDVKAFGLDEATEIGQFDQVFGQMGLELLEMRELLDVLAVADRGAPFVEAMLQTMNSKSETRWLLVLDGLNTRLEPFFSGVRLPGGPIRGMTLLTTREEEVPASLGCTHIHASPYVEKSPYDAPAADNHFDNIGLPGDVGGRRMGRTLRRTGSTEQLRPVVINLIRPTPVASPVSTPVLDPQRTVQWGGETINIEEFVRAVDTREYI